MALDRRESIQHLLRIGLLAPDDFVSCDLSAVALQSRNNLVRVEWAGRGVVVKQPRDPAIPDAATLWTEATLFWLAAHDAGFAPLARWMPRYLHYDEPQRILTIEYVTPATSLAEKLFGAGISPVLAAETGRALATLHGPVSAVALAGPAARLFSPLLPWVLTVGSPDTRYSPATPISASVVQWLAARPDATAGLHRVRAGWRNNAIIHGDVKAPNVLVVSDGSIRLIDWEIATRGDALWDVAGLVHSILIPNPSGSAEPLDHSMARARPLAEALWNGYRSQAPAALATHADTPARVLAMAGARIVQTCLESTHHGTLMPSVPAMLEAAAMLMTRPDLARRHWNWA